MIKKISYKDIVNRLCRYDLTKYSDFKQIDYINA